jgi:hypothetical protein
LVKKRSEEGSDKSQKPEDEEGPFERQREFLEERFSSLSSKDEKSKKERKRKFTLSKESISDMQPLPESLPENFRLKLMKEYRERQIQKQQLKQHTNLSSNSSTNKENKNIENKKKQLEQEKREPFEMPSHPPPPLPPVSPPGNNWIPIGPFVLRQGQGGVKPATSGRTIGIAVAPDGKCIYLASANGGVWRSDDAGENWYSLMEAFDLDPTTHSSDSLACGAIAIDLDNPDRVYVGTGEGQSGAYFGVGPIVSFDGGKNWITEHTSANSPPLAGSAFYALAVDPKDSNMVIAATKQGLYRRESDGTGNFHWVKKSIGSEGVMNSVVVTNNEDMITTFYAAKHSGPIYSSNNGESWTVIGTDFPLNAGRIGLAVQSNNPNVVYALTERRGVWRLDKNNNKWEMINGYPSNLLGNQGWYDLAIAVDPNDINIIYLGGSTYYSGGDWSGSLYRSKVTVDDSGNNLSYTMSNTYIGNSVHADIHTLVFAPGDSNKLWLGCDGGIFYSTNPRGNGDIFLSRNAGLSTLTMNHMDQHPTEDAVIFCGTQDNGGERFTGEEAWLYSSGGDCGYFVINWNDPFKILSTYVYGKISRSTKGGERYSYNEDVSVPLNSNENVLFYAPLVGVPYNPKDFSHAETVAFGSIRPWISTNFGDNWISIPSNSLENDRLDDKIRSLVFFSPSKLYAGTVSGGVYRFDKSENNWHRTRLDNTSENGILPLNGIVTDIAIDPLDTTGNSIYICFGGIGDYRRVWHFDGKKWSLRSGPSVNDPQALLNVQVNSIVVDPENHSHIYIGADIGCWKSIDEGNTWQPFSEGLPDVAVIDLKIHNRRLIRASTHGRGVYERTLDDLPKQGVELFIRHTQLDTGRFVTVDRFSNPLNPVILVTNGNSPDIKLDTPDSNGLYQFPLSNKHINFLEFVDFLLDDSMNVAIHNTKNIITKVYVQVHNRGVIPANNVQVMLLLSNISSSEGIPPPLPSNFDISVRNGTPINNSNWKTIDIVTLDNLRVGSPKIAVFDLSSNEFTPLSDVNANKQQQPCILILIHHKDDQFTNNEINTDTLSKSERKTALKKLKLVQFTGSLQSSI